MIIMREDIRYLSTAGDLPFVIEMAGTSYCDGSYRIFRQHADLAVFEYVLKGTGTVIEDQQAIHPGPGDVYILHPNCRHEYYADPDDPWEKIWFNIRGPVVDGLLQAYQLQRINLVRHCPDQIAGLFRQFLQEAQTEHPIHAIYDHCALIFHELLNALAHQVRQTGTAPGEAERLQAFIQSHLFDPVKLTDMARHIYRSPDYAIRIFREAFHQTPYAYLAGCRIEAAKQLLSGTHLPLQEIAARLCYADQHYFANVFRQSTGLTPRQFRKNSQGTPTGAP